MKKTYFWNSCFCEIQKVLYENPFIFLGKLNQNYFLLYNVIILLILNTELGLIRTTPWPDEKDLFLKFLFLRNSKSFVWEPIYFPRQAKPKILFALHCHYTGDTPYRVWFDLDNYITRWKRPFLKFLFRETQIVPFEILELLYLNVWTFFPTRYTNFSLL